MAKIRVSGALSDAIEKGLKEGKSVEDILTDIFALKPLTPEQKAKALKRFEWLVCFLICRYHFVHRVLGNMSKLPSNQISTMGVWVTEDGKFQLRYNPAFMETLTDSMLVYVLYHEVSHLVLHHCTSRKMDTEEHGMWNSATDLAVNELIEETSGSCERPRDKDGNSVGLFVSELKKNPDFSDIEERQTAEWYYEYLRKKQKEGKGKCSGLFGFDSHKGWKEHEVADERVRSIVKDIDRNSLWGDMTQTQRELVLAAQVRKINWRNLIRTWFGNIAWKERESTRKRPNRRTGYVHPGTRKQYTDRWLVAADTSGSINEALLSEWIGVLNQLADILPIDFMQFDCEKTEDPHPYDRRCLKLEFKGRGGTDFGPVMKIVNERKYKAVMILTDGMAGEPEKPKARVLWVLPKGCHPPVEWGERVYMETRV